MNERPTMNQTANNSQAKQTRRELLKAGGSGIGAIALAGLLENASSLASPQSTVSHSPLVERKPHYQPKVKRVIQLFMNGGPSQFDTFYPKPEINRLDGQELPASFKQQLQATQRKRAGLLFGSPFKFQQHGESGTPVSELFPHVAKHADELCLVHSMQGEIANHSPGLLLTNCGHSALARPSLGSWLLYGLGNESDELPGYVILCPRGLPTAQSRNWTSAFLPGVFQGTHIDIQTSGELIPNLTRKDIRAGQQRGQVALTQFLNRRHAAQRPGDERLKSRIHSMELAFRMQSAGTDAFDLQQEPDHIRTMYGATTQGRNMLIARRLAERGVRYIQCYHGGGQPWDNHSGIVPRITKLAKESDQPIAALLADLKQRGMLDDTLVIWGGEMGRTPTVQAGAKKITQVGRDHHIDGYSIWLAGAGVRGGTSFGATDELGMAVTEDKVTVHDLHATILHLLGLDHEKLTFRYAGREFRLTDIYGNVIREILA
jgi:hypothetical protein